MSIVCRMSRIMFYAHLTFFSASLAMLEAHDILPFKINQDNLEEIIDSIYLEIENDKAFDKTMRQDLIKQIIALNMRLIVLREKEFNQKIVALSELVKPYANNEDVLGLQRELTLLSNTIQQRNLIILQQQKILWTITNQDITLSPCLN